MKTESRKLLHAGAFLPAMPLVLDENRKFDEAGQRRLVRYYMEAGVDGLAVAVHTTQFAIRDPKINLFETVLRVVKSEMDAYAARSGRHLLAIAGVCGEAQLIERTRLIAEVMPVVGFYLQVAVGGRVFSYDYWEKVCAIQNVVRRQGLLKGIRCLDPKGGYGRQSVGRDRPRVRSVPRAERRRLRRQVPEEGKRDLGANEINDRWPPESSGGFF